MAPPQGLAVDAQDRLLDARGCDRVIAQGPQPAGEAGLECSRVEHHEHAREDALAGDAVGQVEQSHEQVLLQVRPPHIAVGPAAPASTARIAMTITLVGGCRRLMEERGSSSSPKKTTTSSRLRRRLLAIIAPPVGVTKSNPATS
jgi:hypothetical protein